MARFRLSATKALLLALILLIGGVAISLFVLPDNTDLARYQAQDIAKPGAEGVAGEALPAAAPDMASLKNNFDAERSSGNLTFATTKAYADAQNTSGYAEGAVAAWEVYLAGNPDDVKAWNEIGGLYYAGGDEDNYQRVLENLARVEPTEERLNTLSGYYNYRKLYDQQAATLQQLIALNTPKKPEYVKALADVASLGEDKEAAISALTTYIEQDPAAAEPAQIEQYIRLLAQTQRQEEAVTKAAELAKLKQDDELTARLAEVIIYEAGPEIGLQYIEAVSPGEVAAHLQPAYARALVQQENYAKALPVLRELQKQGGEYREWYFLALGNGAKKDKDLRKELVEHVKESFAAGDLTEAQKIDRVYALLNAGEKALALDYTERSLQAAEGDAKEQWQKLHTTLTAKPKASRATRSTPVYTLEQKIDMIRQGKMTEKKIRETAFEALNKGRKPEALELFKLLAAQNGPQSADANQLLYLWGARIGGDDLRWVIAQAQSTGAAEQPGWISIIANHASAEDIVAIAQTFPQWLAHPAFEKRYTDSLMQLGDTEPLNAHLASDANQSQSVDAYLAAASRAQGMLDMQTSEAALLKAASLDPNNRGTWLRLVGQYFSTARYDKAREALNRAMSINEQAYTTDPYTAGTERLAMNYYAAQLARRDGNNEQADQYFTRVVQQDQMYSDRDSQVKLLSSQMALGMEDISTQGFEMLLEYHPGDPVLLADYVSALLDRHNYDKAQQVVVQYGHEVVLDPAQPLAVDADPILVPLPRGEMPLVQAMGGGTELKLQFPRPLPPSYLVAAPETQPVWLSYTSTSYDSALIVAQPGYMLNAAATPQGLQITPTAMAPTTSTDALRQQFLRLQLLYARLELETGGIDMALNRLQSLSSEFNTSAEFLGYQANAEYYAWNLKRGLHLAKEAYARDPGNEDLKYLKRNIERFHAEHAKLDYEWQQIGDHDLHVATAEARKQYNGGYETTAMFQNAWIDSATLQRADGRLSTVDSKRWNARISLARFFEDSSVAEATIYGNRDNVGAGLSYQWVNALGTTNVYGEYHRPYWGMVEAIVEDATRDRVGAWHLWRPNVKWSVRGEGSFNNYNIADESSIGESVGLQATVLRTVWDKFPYVAIAYGLDAEYMLGDIDRGLISASSYKYLPLRSREVHALSAILYHDFTIDTNVELNAGYAIDRLGEHGPSIEGRINHYLMDDFEVQLRARYGLEIQETDNNAASIGGYARWIW